MLSEQSKVNAWILSILPHHHDEDAFFMIDDWSLDNMSFGTIHRDVNWEWEKSGWNFGYYFYKWRFLITLRRFIHLPKFERDEESKIYFKFIIAWEHLGAYEQWSLWSTAHLEDCSLGWHHSFGFALILSIV